MEKITLGRTQLKVTPLCFGGSALGDMPATYGYSVDDERAFETINAIFDSPVNFLDSSRIYGFGRSEERIGEVISARGGLPEGFVLATKLDRDPETNRFDADQAKRSLEQSLKALNLDSIPVLHLHDPEHARSLDEIRNTGGAIDALMAFKSEGLCQAVGLAMGRLDIMLPLVKEFDFDLILNHNRYTLLNRSATELFDYAKSAGIGVLNAAPYAGGVLAKGASVMPQIAYTPVDEDGLTGVRKIEEICSRYNIAPGAVALQFSLRDQRIDSTIVGVSAASRVQQTLEWAATEIPAELWAEVAALEFDTTDPEANREYNPG
ncbi:MAG TPA: aldo/keto reductase [Marinobacterium sp.]|nr:aldo/keto reductase [Marinobacterium sp.]